MPSTLLKEVEKMSEPTKDIVVNVTKEIIKNSQRGDKMHCAVSQALALAVPESKNLFADAKRIAFSPNGVRYVWKTSPTVAAKIDAFDHGSDEPFKFTLKIKDATIVTRRPLDPNRVGRPSTYQPALEVGKVRIRKLAK